MGCGSSKSAVVVANSHSATLPDREDSHDNKQQQQRAQERQKLPHRTTEQENNLRNLPKSTVSLDHRDPGELDDHGDPRDRSVKSDDQISIAGSQDSGIETSNERPAKGSHSELLDIDVLRTVPRAVAFDVPLANTSEGSIIKRHPPKRLQRLESVPRMTPAMLEEKLKSAEERKEMELQKKTKSAARTSRRHRQIKEAMEFEKTLKEEEIDRTLSSAERKRGQKQAEIVAKQRLREERAKRAREKAHRLSSMEDVEFTYVEMENDENFNADDEDSWGDPVDPELLLPPPTGTTIRTSGSAVSSESERIYDGRSSPVKRVHPRPGAALRRGSSGTSVTLGLDAFSGRVTSARTQHQLDELFERKNVPTTDQVTVEDATDDFYS